MGRENGGALTGSHRTTACLYTLLRLHKYCTIRCTTEMIPSVFSLLTKNQQHSLYFLTGYLRFLCLKKTNFKTFLRMDQNKANKKIWSQTHSHSLLGQWYQWTQEHVCLWMVPTRPTCLYSTQSVCWEGITTTLQWELKINHVQPEED